MSRRLIVAVFVVLGLTAFACGKSETQPRPTHKASRTATPKCHPSATSICLKDRTKVSLGDRMDNAKFNCTNEDYIPKHACKADNALVFGQRSVSAILAAPEQTAGGISGGQPKAQVRRVLDGEVDAEYGSNRALLTRDGKFLTYYLFEECPGTPDGDVKLPDDQLESSKLATVIIATKQGIELMGEYIKHPCSQGE